MRNCFAGQRVIFNVVNFSKTKSLYREGMAPMVKTTSRPAWQRVPKQNVFYYKCPRHRKGYIMSFVFVFDAAETYEFAYCYPYTYSRLQSFLGVRALGAHHGAGPCRVVRACASMCASVRARMRGHTACGGVRARATMHALELVPGQGRGGSVEGPAR